MKFLSRCCAFAFLVLLCACGFQPIHGDWGHNTGTNLALNNVAIENIPNYEGQALRNHLIDRMYLKGRPAEPTTRLEIVLTSTEADLGLQKDATTTRQEHNLTAVYVLRDLNGVELLRGTVRSIVSYNKLDAQYGTVASRNNAKDRAVVEVGEQIVNRVALYFSEHKTEIEKAEAAKAAEIQEKEAIRERNIAKEKEALTAKEP